MIQNKQIIFTDFNQVEVVDNELENIKEDEVLIQTSISLISTGTELTILEGKDYDEESLWYQIKQMPFTPGYNNIGKVVKIGSKVDESLLGKKVATWGSHSKFVVRHVDAIYEMHEDVKDEHAVFFTIAQIVMNGIRKADLVLGDTVAVYGLGLLGQLTAQLAYLSGASKVYGIDLSTYRLEVLHRTNKQLIGIDPSKGNIESYIKSTNDDELVDVIFEVTGNAGVIPKEFEVLRRQGKMIILSSPKGKVEFDFHDLCNGPSYSIIGAHNASHTPVATLADPYTLKKDAQLFFDMVSKKRLNIENLISHRVHYTEAPAMYQALLNDRSKSMGVIIEW